MTCIYSIPLSYSLVKTPPGSHTLILGSRPVSPFPFPLSKFSIIGLVPVNLFLSNLNFQNLSCFVCFLLPVALRDFRSYSWCVLPMISISDRLLQNASRTITESIKGVELKSQDTSKHSTFFTNNQSGSQLYYPYSTFF